MEEIPLICTSNYDSLVNAINQGDINLFRSALNSLSEDEKCKIFEQACQKPGRAAFIEACISAGCDVNKVNADNKPPIYHILESQSEENLVAFLRSPFVELNVKYKKSRKIHDCYLKSWFISEETPISFLAGQISDENFQKVFPCMQLLIQYGVDLNVPDSQSLTLIMDIMSNSRLSNVNKEVFVRYFASLNNAQIDGDFIYMFFLLKKREENEFLEELVRVVKYSESLQKLFTASVGRETLLIVAVCEDLILALEKMIQLGADINFCVDAARDTLSPVKCACIRGHWRSLEILLKSPELDVNSAPLLPIVVKIIGRKQTRTIDYEKCLKIVMDQRNVDVDLQDECNGPALYYAIQSNNYKAVLELLKRGAYIGFWNKFNKFAISNINAKLLEKHFDTCITADYSFETLNDDDVLIKFDFKNLVHIPESQTANISDELTLIEYITKSKELKHLTMHPLIASFIALKWKRFVNFFYLNFVLYALFAVITVTYIFVYHNYHEPNSIKDAMRVIMFLLNIYIATREMYQFTFSPCMYLKSLENCLECTLVVLVMFILFDLIPDNWRSNSETASILLIAIEIILLSGSLPFWSFCTHYEMLKRVIWSFIKSLSLFAIILLAFALAFYALLHESSNENSESSDGEFDKFSTIGLSIVKTLVMSTGEFNADSINFEMNTFSYIVFMAFVCIVSIVLLNLLNGLAVCDTQAIKSQAELTNFISRANILARYKGLLATSKRLSFCEPIVYRIEVKPNDKNKILFDPLSSDQSSNTRMDSKIVKLAFKVLEKNAKEKHDEEEREKFNERMTKMETTLEIVANRLNELLKK